MLNRVEGGRGGGGGGADWMILSGPNSVPGVAGSCRLGVYREDGSGLGLGV